MRLIDKDKFNAFYKLVNIVKYDEDDELQFEDLIEDTVISKSIIESLEEVPAIPIKNIVERIIALSYMAGEKKYSQAQRDSFQVEVNVLITLLKDFGYEFE